MNNVYVIRKLSKKGVPFTMLYVDMGYRNVTISFDISLISELTNMTIYALNSLELDVPVHVADYVLEV